MNNVNYIKEINSKNDSGFNPPESCERIVDALDSLCQKMFDPENQPPQITVKEAFKEWKAIGEHSEKTYSHRGG